VRAEEAFEGMDAVDLMTTMMMTTMMSTTLRAERNFLFDLSTT
jgi:hypothetical protein